MEHIPPPPPNKPKTSTWLPNSVTSGFKARTKPRSLVSLADWFNNELNYDLIVLDTTDLTRATDPQHHFKCHQFVIHLRSAALLSALLEHQIGKVNHVPVVYLPDLLDLPDLLGYLLRLFYDDQLVEQDEKFRSLTELYKRYEMNTLLYAVDPQLLSDTQRTRHSQLLASDLTRVTPQLDYVTPFSDCRVTIEGVAGTYYCHSIVLQNIATFFGSRDSQGQYTWVIRARDIHPLLEGHEAALLPCLDALLRHFYSGSLTLNGFDAEQLLHLSLIADHYSLTGVKERSEARMISNVTEENCCQRLALAHRYHVLHLRTELLNFVCNALPSVIEVNTAFNHVPTELLRDYRAGPLNVFHRCLECRSRSVSRALKTLRESLGDDAVPLLTAVIDGNTLIHRAIVTEQFDACKVLIDMQLIDLESRTVNGLTALQLLLQSQRFSLSLFCHLINAGVRLDYLTGREILQLLSYVPHIGRDKSPEYGLALTRLIALYYQHCTQPWMNSLWSEERMLNALEHENFDCVGLLWMHFHQSLPRIVHHFSDALRVIDVHKVALSVNGQEHVIDMRVAKFRIEEKLVWYGGFDDYDYDLYVAHEGQELLVSNVCCHNSTDKFLNVLKFVYVINHAAFEDYERLFSMSLRQILRLTSPGNDIEPKALEDYFVNKCNIQ
jgi:hypothetical protein